MRKLIVPLVVGTLALVPLSTGVTGQQIAGYVFPQPGASIGALLGAAGDVDGDGITDILSAGTVGLEGRVWVLSGLDRRVLHEIVEQGVPGISPVLSIAGLGDLDGDGYDDFAVGFSQYALPDTDRSGRLTVYSGASASVLWRVVGRPFDSSYGTQVAAAGDIDGDGIGDVLVTAYRRRYPDGLFEWKINCGAVEARSGRDGSLLFEVSPHIAQEFFGTGLAALGDIDGDQVPDFAVGAYLGWSGSTRPGTVRVYSGAGPTLLYLLEGSTHFGYFGDSLARVGDLDGDGADDFLVGAPFQHPIDGTFIKGVARLYSGASGSLLLESSGSQLYGIIYATPIAGLGDIDGDGVPDFGVAGPRVSAALPTHGRVRIHSGSEQHLLYDIAGSEESSAFGFSLAGLGDLNGDGASDWIVGVPGASYGTGSVESGLALVYRAGPCVARPICSGTPNSAGPGSFLSHGGSLSLAANALTLRASGCPPRAPGIFVTGELATELPFGAGTLCVGSAGGPPTVLFEPVRASSAGLAQIRLESTTLGFLALRPTRVQFLYRDRADGGFGFNASDALELVLCP